MSLHQASEIGERGSGETGIRQGAEGLNQERARPEGPHAS